jgi:uncharacterized cupin superfamily protein
MIVRMGDLEWVEHAHGERYAARRKQLGVRGERLGASVYELEPGKAAFPRHAHLGNEEAIFILSGRATLEVGEERLEVREGDWVALPAGAEHAHKVVNTSEEVVRYLCVSTMSEPDVVLYPDTGKVGVFAGAPPGGDKAARTLHAYLDAAAQRGYWEGE